MTIDLLGKLARPLTGVAKHCTIEVLPSNAEGRNGQFRNGGHFQRSWLDTDTTHTAQSQRLYICFQAKRRENGRAVYRTTQQSSGNVNGTVQKPTHRQNIEVRILPVAQARPNVSQALSRTLCACYLIVYCTLTRADRQGWLERVWL